MKTRKLKRTDDCICNDQELSRGHRYLCPAWPKPTHTPGPWRTHGVTATGQSQIAPIGWFNHDRKHTLQQEWEPNARLIAAAPELLEALKKVQAVMDDPKGYLSVGLCLDVKKSIAKAEGRV